MNVLITGGAGFIGSNLVRCLAASGDHVRVIDDLSTGSRENLRGIERSVQLTVADVRDADALGRAMHEVDVVYHLAAVSSVSRSVIDPLATHAVNVNGTLSVLSAARRHGVRRIVYGSSSAVYGDAPRQQEDVAPRALSPYAASKVAAEMYCLSFARVYGLETIVLRFFNVFGPRQDPHSEHAAVVPRFIARMLSGRPPVIFGDGRKSRDFTFVANAVQACVLAGTAGEPALGEVINIGSGRRYTLFELAAALNHTLGTDFQPILGAPWPGEVPHSQADISKASRLLGYRPLVTFHQGLADTARWYGASNRGASRSSAPTRSRSRVSSAQENRS